MEKLLILKVRLVFNFNDFINFAIRCGIGEVSEWFKEHAWKVCIPQKGIASSNLAFSAEYIN